MKKHAPNILKFLAIFFIHFCFLNLSSAEVLKSHVEISAGQHVAFESQIVDPNQITLVLLPGVFRGLTTQDNFIYLLVQNKINFVAVHFSTQPLSVSTYKTGQKTHFEGGQALTSAEFVDEVMAVIEALKVKRPLLVSLSYSGTLSEHFSGQKFPLLIETAPLGRLDEEASYASEVGKAWEDWLSLFPFIGEYYKQLMKDQIYRDYWSKVAKKYAQGNEKLSTEENLRRLTDGYIAQAKAIENYDIRRQNFMTSPKRIFIFGENENPKRLKLQKEALAIYQQSTGHSFAEIVIPKAGHTIPSDQPKIYFDVLLNLIKAIDKR